MLQRVGQFHATKMEYNYDNHIKLLLAHMNIEDIIDAAETLYQLEEAEEEESSLLSEGESLSPVAMDGNEEIENFVSQESQEGYTGGAGSVRHGTVTDLLSFVNLLSHMQAAALQHLPEEMGVLLNKVSIVLSLYQDETLTEIISASHDV